MLIKEQAKGTGHSVDKALYDFQSETASLNNAAS